MGLRRKKASSELGESDRENFNPFSRTGTLSREAFTLTVIIIVAVTWFLNAECLRRIELLKSTFSTQDGQLQPLLVHYGIWLFGNLIAYTFTSFAVSKRWNDILGIERLGFLYHNLVKVCLLSPLAGIYLAVFSLAMPNGSKEGILARFRFFPVFLVGLVGFHLIYVGAQAMQGKSENLGVVERHVLPYLNPSLRTAHAVAVDAIRVIEAAERTKDLKDIELFNDLRPHLKSAEVYLPPRLEGLEEEPCKEKKLYLGQEVRDCLIRTYWKMNDSLTFLSPVFGLLVVVKSQMSVGEQNASKVDTANPKAMLDANLSMLANNVSGLEQILKLIEVGPSQKRFFDALTPSGLLRYYGSPEISFLTLLQDGQRYSLRVRVIEKIRDQIGKLKGQMKPSSQMGELPPEFQVYIKRIDDLLARADRIYNQPFVTNDEQESAI